MYTRADIDKILDERDDAVERGIVRIYNSQTADEQDSNKTIHANGVGFSAIDSRLGTYLAKWVMDGKHLNGDWLIKARKMSKKYSKQLVVIANTRL